MRDEGEIERKFLVGESKELCEVIHKVVSLFYTLFLRVVLVKSF